MTIYLDVSAAVHHRAGLGRYAESLAHALVAQPTNQLPLSLFYNRERGIEPLVGLEHLPARTVALGYKPWRMLVWMGQLARISFDRLLPGAELFHATEHLLLPLRAVPTVLTVHDLIFRHLPEHHKPLNRWYLNLTMPLYCRRATHIIAISECTRRDLIAAYSLPPEKITVIHEAAD
ncbi:MAG: glycosyltransferase, partial [Chloroflexota bacterium]|nr:glycosyltransferase [Chloroflexota bacterium]